MTDLEHLLQPAMGYLQLGMLEEANDEIEALPQEAKTDKVVLGIQVLIYQGLGAWPLMSGVSGFLAHEWPEESDHWIWFAYATRRCRSIAEAELILKNAVRLHPSVSMIHFNLACYAALLGNLDSARENLAAAISLNPESRSHALTESDLQP
jgi:Tfp pilus assembly protein PilF